MKYYVLSFRNWNQKVVDTLESLGLKPYAGMWNTRLCALVSSEDRENMEQELNAQGYFPESAEVFENQTA